MRRILFVTSIIFACVSCIAQQSIERLSLAEISENSTPKAVAYNFVTSVIEERYHTTVELMTLGYFFELMPDLFGDGIPINQLFSSEYTHNIVDMRPVVKLGYELVITDSQPLDTEEYFEEGSKYRGAPAFSITFNCADTNNNFYDGSHGSYDTDVTIRVVKEDDKWRVFGFE